MAKKKKQSQQQQQALSPEKYIKQRARSLKIDKCYINDSLQSVGEGLVIVTRKRGPYYCMAAYLVDAYCLGVKDTYFDECVTEEDLVRTVKRSGVRECAYEEAHNWIYGSIAFAEEAGIKPHKDFSLTQYVLEEDTDDVPLIDYDFGRDGKHFLVAHSEAEANLYLPLLERMLGKGNYDYMMALDDDDHDDYDDDDDYDDYDDDDDYNDDDDDDDYDDDDDDEEVDLAKVLRKMIDYTAASHPQVKYNYKHPDYPATLHLHHPWIQGELEKDENSLFLKAGLTRRILALPREELRQDLEAMILYHIGLTCEDIADDYDDGRFNGTLSTAVMLLGTVGNDTSSLDVVLETMRQSFDFLDYHYGDAINDVLVPTLYNIGQNQTQKLMDYMKEEGIISYAKSLVLTMMAQIALQQPERRQEVLEWFRQFLEFALEHVKECKACDAELTGLLMCELVDLQAIEVLPEVKALFDEKLVDEGICGSYKSVVDDMKNPLHARSMIRYHLDIYERFEEMRERYGD